MKENNSKKKILVVVAIILVAAIAAAAVIWIFNSNNDRKNAADDEKKTAATQIASKKISVTPCDEEDAQIFSDSLTGAWSSYTKDGVAFTYTFEDDGTVHYKKDGENAEEYTYTFEDGLFSIKSAEKNFVYQCSKDAVGMMADYDYGAVKNFFAEKEEEIPDFNGCVYIADDFMYLGTVCLCRDDKLGGFDGTTIEGDWLGVSGDTVHFSSDGKYVYRDGGADYNGTYSVDDEKKVLTITLTNTTEYDKTKWGIEGRVLHIDNRYFFKVSK